jgi:SAM-dependent methyltransferase
MPANDEVTAADIARLAGVGRAAVSNWRRRYADFPRPVGGPATSPTFDLGQVEAWLRANGKQLADPAEAVPSRIPVPDRLIGGVPAHLAGVVAGLIPPLRQGLVLDPACGPGLMLAAAAQRLGPSVRYAGQDGDPANVTAAANTLAAAGMAGAEIAVGSAYDSDALASYRGVADVVVCVPPGRSSWSSDEASLDLPWEFGPPHPADPYLAWLQVCYSYLKADGHAIMPMPYAASVRASGRRIRAELLRAGALRQVVALPEQFGGRMPGPWQIWVLHRPAGRPAYTVRLVDLTDADPDDVPTDTKRWRAAYDDDARTRDVASIELLDEDVLLVPARHIDPPVRDVSGDYADQRAELAKAVTTLDAELPAFRRSTEPAAFPMTTIVDLLRAGAIAFVDKDTRLQAGDVVVPSGSHRWDATVLSEPVPAHPERAAAEVIRCDSELLDPYFLACFLRSEINRRQASGTQGGTFRLDLRRARVPRMPLAEQRRYGDAFRRLTAVTDRIDSVAGLATNAVQTAVYGLTSGLFMAEDASSPRNQRNRRTT